MPQRQQYYQAGPQEGGVVAGGPPPQQAPGPPPGGPVEDMKRRHPHPYGEGAGEGWGGPPPGGDWGADTRGQFNQGGKGMTMDDAVDELGKPMSEWGMTRPGRRLWDPEGSRPPSGKFGGFGPFDYTRFTPPIPGGGSLMPADLGFGWEGEGWEFEGGLQGNVLSDRNVGPGGGVGGFMHRKHLHPYLSGGIRRPMPFGIPGDWTLDGGITIDPDNNWRDTDVGFNFGWDLMGGGPPRTGYY